MSTPQCFKKLSVTTLSKDFRKAIEIVKAQLPDEPDADEVFVKVAYAGVNASDLNYTNGAYFKGRQPPFDCGLEGMGTVIAVGKSVTQLKVGSLVIFQKFGCFSEYVSVPETACFSVSKHDPEMLVLLVSGLTAAVALGEVALPKKGDVALVTAAAGGTGQIAVQLLKKLYNCTVIGTCSSDEKADFLKSLGCDYTINYKKESLDAKLSEFAPTGLNIVYECVGGETFNTSLRHLAVKGRLVSIGFISSYKSDEQIPFQDPDGGTSLTLFLLKRSASLHGFFLLHFKNKWSDYNKQLMELVRIGSLKLCVDKKNFKGIESITDAVDHLYTGKSYGKVYVQIS